MNRRTLTMFVCAGFLTWASTGRAQAGGADVKPDAKAVEEAGRHFTQGVELFKDADLRGAITEFRRAQEIAPNPRVLFNLGQAYYELKDYPEALRSLKAYLAGVGPDLPAERRRMIEADIRSLKARIATVEIHVNVIGAKIVVDDIDVGVEPLAKPLQVSVGRHRVIAQAEGGREASKSFDVAGGDVLPISLDIPTSPAPEPAAPPAPVAALAPTPLPALQLSEPAPSPTNRTAMWVGWSATGVLGATAVVTGVLALAAESSYHNQIKTVAGDATAAADHQRTLAHVTDALWPAAVVAGAISTYLTFNKPSPGSAAASQGAKRVGITFGPGGARIAGTF